VDQEHLIDDSGYPLSAIVGADEAKRAILAALVSDDVRTVLIVGKSGSGKTMLVRSAAGVCGRGIINIPLGTTEYQVFGGMDLEETLKSGHIRAMPGILERANGCILCIDDANLMEVSLLQSILDAVVDRRTVVERDGFSKKVECDTILLATMNTLEAAMNEHVLDRFDICVKIGDQEDEDARYEVTRRRVAFDRDRIGFCAQYDGEQEACRNDIAKARARIPFVSVPDDVIALMAELCIKLDAEGHRGDIALANTSIALAALSGRDIVTVNDMKEAAHMCLGHRMKGSPDEGQSSAPQQGGEPPRQQPNMAPDRETMAQSSGRESNDEQKDHTEETQDTVFAIGSTFSVIDFVALRPMNEMRQGKGSGRHDMAKFSGRNGRYIRAIVPKSKITDLAFDATLRAAAPYQHSRPKGETAVILERSDYRQKIRESKSGVAVMFLVDGSGSMGVRKRMVSIKGAVFSLLQESYRNRDKVGLISFRKESAELLLPFTKSVDFAYRKLKEVPTGGTTPLAAGMMKAYAEVIKERKTCIGERCYVIMTTDGRANVPVSEGREAFEDAMVVAQRIGDSSSAVWIVVDTGTGYPHTDNAVRLCERLNGVYLRLEDLNATGLSSRIKTIIKNEAA
jgi:magnesium chelatase subunit D